ncbi:uncharacterized protein B0P05DRAFT_562020 [Gilbertella persicaria]|uniref:uncharacterized protein n=1 Tax=Gilbertella persicaria TaxID=101096 RepID=UPI00221FA8A6|nr:uncharacterized protein B0P05DRAFT_562020 [Gilbertella persicaria]KAI8052581.1 hypothetical protein B0P05DRAFT_562020 [Gilbertella persicaria]
MPISLSRSNTEKPLKRASTLTSRVKRFSSKLVRSSSYKSNPSPLPSIIDTSLKSSQSSLPSSTSVLDDSEEEHIVTPTTLTFLNHDEKIINSYANQDTVDVLPVLPETQSEKTTRLFANDNEFSCSTVSLVRSHIASAFKQIDQEIEHEFDQSHYQMIEAIRAPPRFTL